MFSFGEAFYSFLTFHFNDCIKQNVFPSEFKVALVTPLHKKGIVTDINNYKGISVLTPLNKVYEKILYDQIRIFFEINKLFSSNQHGFRASHSCETALHEVVSNCLFNIDKKLINLLLFIDFKKAFDMVDSRLLMIKL